MHFIFLPFFIIYTSPPQEASETSGSICNSLSQDHLFNHLNKTACDETQTTRLIDDQLFIFKHLEFP